MGSNVGIAIQVHKEVPRLQTRPWCCFEEGTNKQTILIKALRRTPIGFVHAHEEFIPECDADRVVGVGLPVHSYELTNTKSHIVAAFCEALLEASARLERELIDARAQDHLLPDMVFVTTTHTVGKHGNPGVAGPK